MEIFYKAYTRTVQNKLYYFIKKYLSFPEYSDVEDILEGYGMHTDFDKACSIAGVDQTQIKQDLFAQIQSSAPQAKIIELKTDDISLNKKIGS